MKKTNSQLSNLYIALQPQEMQDDNKQWTKICDSTSCQLNIDYKKTDSTYFCNGGETTSTIVGRTMSLTVSVDYDNSNDSHKYLRDLLLNDFTKANDQMFRLEVQMNEDGTTWNTLSGKSCIQFKSMPPSGSADELAKIEFDVFPQDRKWEWGTK